MLFGAFIILRVLFIACMVFILGYVFGGFSRKPVLATITKVAAILLIVLFFAAGAIGMRARSGHAEHWRHGCDSTQVEWRK